MKIRRVTRSGLATETYVLTACYDYCFTVTHDLTEALGFKLAIQLFADSNSIFDTIMKLSSVSENSLPMNLTALLQSYASGEIQTIVHLLPKFNINDLLTKKMHHPLLSSLLQTGKLSHPVNRWILHTEPSKKRRMNVMHAEYHVLCATVVP